MNKRLTYFQVFLTNQFDPKTNFIEEYKEILDVPGNPTDLDVIYAFPQILKGRFVIIERQRATSGYLDLSHVEVLSPSTIE